MNADFNLPPGCTVNDINRAAGAYDAECDRCGETVEARELDDVGHCPACQEENETERVFKSRLRAMSNNPDED